MMRQQLTAKIKWWDNSWPPRSAEKICWEDLLRRSAEKIRWEDLLRRSAKKICWENLLRRSAEKICWEDLHKKICWETCSHHRPSWHERSSWSCYGDGTLMYELGMCGLAVPLSSSWSWAFSLSSRSFIDMLQQNCYLFGPPGDSGSPTRLRYQLSQGTSATSYWSTCGGHGSTTLPGPGRLLTNFGAFLMVMPHVGWVLSGLRALHLH